ncbi:MAG: ABC transporter permease [Bacillota bacterium]|nr:ABC transporter permease [Bacillota bacterium]MDW7677715.1 ABC transporter permease [Bacillota bacterium]
MDLAKRMKDAGTWISNRSGPIALAVLLFYGFFFVGNFSTETNLTAILLQYSIIGCLALGQLIVILTGGIDLSQGSQIALATVVCAVVMSRFGVIPGIIMALLIPTMVGFSTGLLVSRLKMPAFIVTLGMLGVSRGLAMRIANARPVSINIDGFKQFGYATLLRIPVAAIIFGIAAILVLYLLKKRKLGRYLYAVGSSEESTRLSGVNIMKVKLFAYTASGFLTAVGGVLLAARLGSGSPIGGSGYELESIAAVVVGGGSLFGGIGGVGGTVSGVFLFGVINSILNLTGIPPFWQGTMKGLIILAAVALSQMRKKSRNGA